MTTTPPPVNPTQAICDFYDGLYHSSLYAQHHRVLCNVGFHPVSATPTSAQDTMLTTQHPNDGFSLQLYHELMAFAAVDAPVERVADIGCGAGGGLCKLSSLFPTAELYGVDLSSQALARTKENWIAFIKHLQQQPSKHDPNQRNRKQKPHLLQQDMANLSAMMDQSMDMVVAIQSLSEAHDVDAAMKEMVRILKPGGQLCIADFAPMNDPALDRIGAAMHQQVELKHVKLLKQRVMTLNAAIASKLNSTVMEELIVTHIPTAFQSDLQTFFFTTKSSMYEALRRGDRGYRMMVLEKLDDDGPAIQRSAFVVMRQDEQVWSEEEEEEDEDEDNHSHSSDDEIDDHDLPNYYAYQTVVPQLQVVKDNYDVILEEMKAVMEAAAWPHWPEKHYKSVQSEWRVFPFCYTFPAWDATKTNWVEATCAVCPQTVAILRQIPGIRTALLSKLGPQTTLGAHRGWADLSNHILRCHLGLIVPTLPNGKPCCYVVVGGEAMAHEENELMVFDDSKLHYAYNHHPDQTRVVLIIDLYRPDHLPRGRATGGHTDELDEFIETFGRQALGNLEDE